MKDLKQYIPMAFIFMVGVMVGGFWRSEQVIRLSDAGARLVAQRVDSQEQYQSAANKMYNDIVKLLSVPEVHAATETALPGLGFQEFEDPSKSHFIIGLT